MEGKSGFSLGAQRFILEFFKRTKGHFWFRDQILARKDFSWNGTHFVEVVKELSPEWVETIMENGNNYYRLTRNGWDLGTHLYRKWLRINGQ